VQAVRAAPVAERNATVDGASLGACRESTTGQAIFRRARFFIAAHSADWLAHARLSPEFVVSDWSSCEPGNTRPCCRLAIWFSDLTTVNSVAAPSPNLLTEAGPLPGTKE
jgi:hypothetical protein